MADFSFSKLLRHLDEGTLPVRSESSPTEAHMRAVMEAYVTNIGKDFSDFAAKHLATDMTGEDPVGANSSRPDDDTESFSHVLERLLDVPFAPRKAELVSPVSFSLENKAAMAFRLWAEVDGRNIAIDIVDVMTFDASGKICDVRAHWGVENVTLLD